MKKVLLIAHPFPPLIAMGAQRPYRLAKYFPRFGWEPVVLTVKRSGHLPEGIRVIETESRDIIKTIKSKISSNSRNINHEKSTVSTSQTMKDRKFVKFLREIINFPDDRRSWYGTALSSASRHISHEGIDAIISTSSPVTSHLIARKLKEKFNMPWIADLRDLWSQNPYSDKYALIKYFERRLELKTLSEADALVTVTMPWINTLKEFHKEKNIYCITNGYDEEDFPADQAKPDNKFIITYAGSLYNGKRDPSLLFEALAQLIKENRIRKDVIELRFYGREERWLEEMANKYNLNSIVKLQGTITPDMVLKKLRESQLLLILVWNNKKEEGFCPGKLYEYFASKRPIIATGWPGSIVQEMLHQTNAGRFADDAVKMRNILLEYYDEFISKGVVRCCSNSNIANYTYSSITKKYAEILDGLVS